MSISNQKKKKNQFPNPCPFNHNVHSHLGGEKNLLNPCPPETISDAYQAL